MAGAPQPYECPNSGGSSSDLATGEFRPFPVPKLEIVKKADEPNAKSGDTVTYTVGIKNVGDGSFEGTFTDDMGKVLSSADYNNDGMASSGTLAFITPDLSWTGVMAPGDKAKNDVSPGTSLVNVVVPPAGVETGIAQHAQQRSR